MNIQFQKTKICLTCFLVAICLIPQLAAADSNVDRPNPFRQNAVNDSAVKSESNTAIARANELSNAFRSASSRVLPALVAIETRADVTTAESMNNGMPFHRAPPEHAKGIGSGVIVDASGIILTNNHVVMGGQGQVTVRLSDGREFGAVEVLTDPKTDIAVIRIEGAKNLVAAAMGDSNQSEIGDWVLALGQPFGLESTVTAGIISAKYRGIGMTERESFIQTDAAINPGNSGGPLVNLNGEIVGISTAISSRSGGNEGIGFAIPISLARWVGSQLLDHGIVQRSYIGVGIQELDATIAKKFGVPPKAGVVVTHLQPNSPATDANLSIGDVLVSFNNQGIREPSQLQLAVERCKPGQKKPLKIIRGTKQLNLSIIPAELPGESVRHMSSPSNLPTKSISPSSKLGMRVESLRPEIAERLGLADTQGVVVTATARGSAAEQAGLQPGVVIVEVDRKPIRDIREFAQAMNEADSSEGILLLVKAGEGARFLILKSPS